MSFTNNILASQSDELPAPELAVVLVFPEMKSSFLIIAALLANLLFIMGMCLSTGFCMGSRRERRGRRMRTRGMMRAARIIDEEDGVYQLHRPLLGDEYEGIKVEVGTPIRS